MTDSIIKAGIQISTQVGGGEQIDKLVKSIAETSDETSQLSQEAQKLAQEWQKAQQNTALITHYKTVKSSLADNREEIAHTEQQLRKLDVQMSNGKTKEQQQQFNQLKEKLVQLNQQKRALSENLRQTSIAMNEAGISSKHLANNQKYFADQAQKTEQKLQELNQQAQKTQQIAQSKAILGMDVDDRARKEIAELDKAFADLKRNGGLSQAELARAAQLHAKKVGEIEQSLQRVKPSLSEVAQGVAGIVGQAGGLTYVAKQAIEFESAMASVKKVTDGTPEQYAKLSSEIKTMAGELGVLPAELAEIAAAGGQANVALEELPKFTRMAAEMAVAFKIPAEQAGDMAAKIGNVFQIPISKVGELMDAVNVLGNNTAAKEAEISNVLMRIGGNAKQFGLVAEEAAALGAAFISLGKAPEVAGTAINALLTKLQTSTEQGADFKNSLQDIGLSAQEMADNIAANPQAALTDFLQRIEQLDKQSRSIVLTKMFGAEYSDDLALLAGSLKTYEDALAHATDKAQTLGAMQEEVNKSLQTTESKINQAKSAMSSAAATVGEALLPVLRFAAEGAGGVANAIDMIASKYPLLAQLAVIFAGGKVAVAAYQLAVKMAGTESVTAMTKTDASVNKVRASLKGAAVDAKIFGMSMQSVHGAVGKLGTGLGGLANNAAMLGASFVGGFGIGEALYQESEMVRWAGDKIAAVFAGIHSLATTGSLDQYRENFRTYAESEKELAELKRQTALEEQKKAEATKQASAEQAQQIRALTETYRAQQAQYQGNEQSLRVLTAAGKENSVIADQLREQNKQLEQQFAKTKDELSSLNANIADTSPLAKNRQALQDLGLSAEQVATGISQAAQKSLDDFKLAAQGFGNDADAMAQIFQAAVKKMDTPEALSELKQSLNEVGQEAGLTAEQINQIAQSAPQAGLGLAQISKPLGEAEAAATALGIELQNAFSGSSPAMQSALAHFTTLRGQLSELAAQGLDTGQIVQQSLSKLTETAQNQADIDALKQAIQGLGQSGALSLQEVERAILATDVRLQELKGTIDPTEAAFKKLGIQSKESLRLAAEETRLAFETVKASGNATSADLKAAFERTADALLASGDANQRAWVESQAAAYNYKVAVDETGKANLQAAEKTVQAAQTQVAAHNQVAQAAQQAAQSVEKSGEKASQSMEQHGKRLSDFATKVDYTLRQTGAYFHMGTAAWQGVLRDVQDMYIGINQAIKQLNADTENGGNIAMSLAKAEAYAISNAHKLDKVTLNNLNQAIDKAKQKMAQLAEEAAHARAAAEKELLSAQGRDDEVARLEQQQKIEQLRKQQAAAQKSGNRDAANDYEAAIVASNKAFEERLRREAEQREQARLEAEQREREKAEQQRQRELEKQQREREKAEQKHLKELEKQPVNVNVDANLNDLIAVMKNRDDLVANAAAQKILSDLHNAVSRQR
ncbi:phage tail tape measure protein [Wielerella bovis]|uniref:phage tail tape measure protein n=1 Tax=Wielerella bovis TaxID=2917790 RepID=UPI0020198CB4|nr:phage tail tape measure protein [Wielerella bovis]ULJ61073.1 phage tail tape measure protein [Wielerella bovis]